MTKSQSLAARRLGRLLLVSLAAVAVLVPASCGTAQPTDTPLPPPTATPRPTATAIPTPEPLDLVVLHTNDTLGYTEPCG